MFIGDDGFGVFDPFGRRRIEREYREKQLKLAENPKIYRMKAGHKIKCPVGGGYILRRGKALAKKWVGSPSGPLSREREERQIFTLTKSDEHFRAVYEIPVEQQGHLIVVFHTRSNGFALKRHMKTLQRLFFDHLKLKSVMMRASTPRDDRPFNTKDRRMDLVTYETEAGTEKRTVLFKTWLTMCQRSVATDRFDQTAGDDELLWCSPHVEVDDELRRQLNSTLPLNHPWKF